MSKNLTSVFTLRVLYRYLKITPEADELVGNKSSLLAYVALLSINALGRVALLNRKSRNAL